MLDLRYLREEREKLERALKNRGYSLDILEKRDIKGDWFKKKGG
jgi:hypothetical protein